MKKLGILVVLTVILSMTVSATTTCDINGNGSPDVQDAAYMAEVLQWHTSQDLRFDWNSDGRVDLSDIGLFASLISQEGWCHEVLYPMLVEEEEPTQTVIKNYYTTTSGGSGMSEGSFWNRLTGEYSLYQKFDNFMDYLFTIFETKKDAQDREFRNAERYCKLMYGLGTPESGECAWKEKAVIYNQCYEVPSSKFGGGMVKYCP